ncbi:hypothetical protein MK805_13730 [Shimazuella sp. AN120528]|uniref:hypothetical protein n=1 Tax=Shimazuella soli TaxID=1892854 RepID=UPI001F111A03|nr:hypothetical protein [Shimazuella soli]MCH5586002.1 hypothetical protein [Shimazuella soli]
MTRRNTLLIGSMPFLDERDAMTKAIQILGDSLISLPDGEIGEKSEEYPNGNRSAWINSVIDSCLKDKEHWDTLKEAERGSNGFPLSYQDAVKLQPKHSAADIDQYLNFGYLDYFKQSYPIFQQLRTEYGLSGLKFQVGIPTGLALSLIMLRPLQAFRYQEAFNRQLAYEVNEMIRIAEDDVIIQIEAPAEIALAQQLPKMMNGIAVNSLLSLVEKLDTTTTIGLHFCWGDLNNKALTHAKTLDKMVHFANKLIEKWPEIYRLEYVHFPLAEGEVPPSLELEYYKPLKYVHLPENIRFVAGFIHEKRNFEESKKILKHIESVRSHTVDIACSCGLGRRNPEVAIYLLKLTGQLLEVDGFGV